MKTTIICFMICIASQAAYSQSSVVYDSGTSINVGAGADLCADGFTINGTSSWTGTRCSSPVAVETAPMALPKVFSLSHNYPNPFNPSTTISFEIPSGSVGITTVRVYDLLGRAVATLVDEKKSAGSYSVIWDASSLSSGTYFYRLESGNNVLVKKLILLK